MRLSMWDVFREIEGVPEPERSNKFAPENTPRYPFVGTLPYRTSGGPSGLVPDKADYPAQFTSMQLKIDQLQSWWLMERWSREKMQDSRNGWRAFCLAFAALLVWILVERWWK